MILYGVLLNRGGEIVIGASLFTIALIAAITIILRRTLICEDSRGFWQNTALFIIIPGFCAMIAAFHVRTLVHASEFKFAEKVGCYFTGTVLEVKMTRYAQEAVLEIASGVISGRCRIAAYLPVNSEITSGQIIHFTRMPRFIGKDNTSGYFLAGLLRRGICGTVTLSRDEFTLEDTGTSEIRALFRKDIARRIERIFSNNTASLLKGLYFGNKNHIDKGTIQDFTRAGVLHILAASGTHLATLVCVPLVLFSFFSVDRRLSFLLISLIVVAYLLITDMPVSLLRAFAMFIFGGLHLIIDADRKPLNILFHAASWILIFAPWELYQLGFQLTFAATAGIFLFYRNCYKTFDFLPKAISVPLALTVSAQSLVYPVLALQLGEVNIISIISNFVIVPLIQLIFAGSMLLVVLDAILPFSISFAAALIDWMFNLAQYLAGCFAMLPGHFAPRYIPPFLIIPWALFIIPCLPITRLRFMRAAALPVSCICAWVLLHEPVPLGNTIAYITDTANAQIQVDGSCAVIDGEVSSIDDAREIVRIIKNHHVRTAKIVLRKLDYKSGAAALHIVKNIQLSSFEIAGAYTMGRYLEKLFEVLERDGVNIVVQSQPDTRREQ